MEDLLFWVVSSIILFLIGLYGLITKKDGLKMVIAIEILVTAANAIFIGVGYLSADVVDPLSQTYTILSLGIGGAIVGVSLAVLTAMYQKKSSVDLGDKIILRW